MNTRPTFLDTDIDHWILTGRLFPTGPEVVFSTANSSPAVVPQTTPSRFARIVGFLTFGLINL